MQQIYAGTTSIGVLLVEDEALISEWVADVLIEQGFRVFTAHTAREALNHLDAGADIDVLFTDINLPGHMDGIALARLISEQRPGLPVVYASGRRMMLDPAIAVAGSVFVPKPYDPGRVAELLVRMVGRSVERAIA